MKNEIQFHPTQIEAINFIIDSLKSNTKVVALVGAGGTGKSEILSDLPNHYEEIPKDLYFAATTNKAVSRLLEVLPTAATIHSLTTKPNYTKLYNELVDFFDSFKDIEGTALDSKEADKQRMNYIKGYYFSKETKSFITYRQIKLEEHRDINDLLGSLDMNCFSEEMFDGYVVNDSIENSAVIVDECSMLPTESEYYKGSLVTIGLDVIEKVFTKVVLVGDNSQLPPINGESSFDGIPFYELTKNFRSEVDLLEAISYAREGGNFHNFESKSRNVKVVYEITDEWYSRTYGLNNVVHIVYRNNTRHNITKKIRKGKGSKPHLGEPIMLRGRGNDYVQKGEIGIFNQGKIDFENDSITLGHWDRFDEYSGKQYGKYQFGYAITCHLAQGSSFDHVIVHAYDIPQFIDSETKRKWLYTAISRARKSLTIIL